MKMSRRCFKQYRFSILITLTLVLVTSLMKGEELRTLIPSASELIDFRVSGEPEYYNQNNLWDYINGAAPGYLVYGFQEMVTFLVEHKKNQIEIVTDIYDMGDSLNAFGIYSVERSPGSSAEQFGAGSYKTDNTLYFWKDRYYVKLMAYELSLETFKSLSLLAQLITQKIQRKGKIPYIFTHFPKSGQIQSSERYIPRDVLGQDYFANGYSIEYDQDNNKYQILLIQGENAKEARQNFQNYLSFIHAVGEITNEYPGIGEQAFAGIDNFDRTILFSRKGAFIIAVTGLKNQKIAQEIINNMFLRLINPVTR